MYGNPHLLILHPVLSYAKQFPVLDICRAIRFVSHHLSALEENHYTAASNFPLNRVLLRFGLLIVRYKVHADFYDFLLIATFAVE